jgi:hypothetical protein
MTRIVLDCPDETMPPLPLAYVVAAFDNKPFVCYIERLANPTDVVDDDDHAAWWLVDPAGVAGGEMIRLEWPVYYLHLDDFDPVATICRPLKPGRRLTAHYDHTEDK